MPQAGPGDTPEEQLGQASAHYLRRHLLPGATIGIGWGDTVLRALSGCAATRRACWTWWTSSATRGARSSGTTASSTSVTDWTLSQGLSGDDQPEQT